MAFTNPFLIGRCPIFHGREENSALVFVPCLTQLHSEPTLTVPLHAASLGLAPEEHSCSLGKLQKTAIQVVCSPRRLSWGHLNASCKPFRLLHNAARAASPC
ncbi:uncharacterized protein PV09_09255 [Verruconis gallopava]|uniref:Uncharacterized protein n=1 Tax=Verruconis gallopava TaxID=253628 RepID=A0A0D1ZY77_9PEZI|nr:uncharacterized protein PV09_09255 [Verruconis gallopava]KIV99029.1 hypothetical protein PV09_09255 [Verruconis gallopava]